MIETTDVLSAASLPSRERGLKCENPCCLDGVHTSLPSRERGLKSIMPVSQDIKLLSLPSRERGLKSQFVLAFYHGLFVAPFAGAWIEISNRCCRRCGGYLSLPSRERGLKFLWLKGYAPEIEVAPFAGAWIEIADCADDGAETARRSLRGSVD